MNDLARLQAKAKPRQSEKSFQAAVIQLAKLCGWSVYFVHDSRHSPKGWPDLVLLRGNMALFRECKTDTGKVTPEQYETYHRLQRAGLNSGIWRPSMWDEIEAMLKGTATSGMVESGEALTLTQRALKGEI